MWQGFWQVVWQTGPPGVISAAPGRLDSMALQSASHPRIVPRGHVLQHSPCGSGQLLRRSVSRQALGSARSPDTPCHALLWVTGGAGKLGASTPALLVWRL